MLVDDAGDPSLRTTEMLATAMLEHGLVGRGVANHARAVGLYPRPSLERLAGLATPRRARVRQRPAHRTAAPAGARARPRWVCPWRSARTTSRTPTTRSAGTTWSRSRSSPRTRSNAVDSAGIDLVYDAVTTTAADVLGVEGHRLEVGGNADLVVHRRRQRCATVLAQHDAPAYVVASGRLVASSTSSTTYHLANLEQENS